MLEPPTPGMPQSTINQLARATFRDGFIVKHDGSQVALGVDRDTQTWQLYPVLTTGVRETTSSTFALLQDATAMTDGGFTATNGNRYNLTRSTLTDGTHVATAIRS